MDKQKEKLKKMLIEEREKVKGYEQIGRIHSAYIAILLNRLKATEDNAVVITKEEVTQAIGNFEARAIATDESVSLYCEETE